MEILFDVDMQIYLNESVEVFVIDFQMLHLMKRVKS